MCQLHLDYSYDVTRSKNLPYGTNRELININFLKNFIKRLDSQENREYLEEYFKFPNVLVGCISGGYKKDIKDKRLTVDYLEDINFLNILIKEGVNHKSTMKDILKAYNKNEHLYSIIRNKLQRENNKKRSKINTSII